MTEAAQSQGIFHYYTGLILPDSDNPERTDKFGIDFYFNSWVNLPTGVKVEAPSIGVNVYRIYDIPFGKSPFGIGFGYEFSSHNVHHNAAFVEQVDISNGDIYTALTPYSDTYNYRKNKISLNYFEVPFELRIRSKRKWSDKKNKMVGPFRFYPGFKAGYLVNIHATVKDDDGKFKFYNYKNLERIRYGATLRIGYGRLSVYGFYALTSLFKENKGDDLQSFAIGFSISSL